MTNPENRSRKIDAILHGARQLFARRGYHGTNTKELARFAGIAENTLFRYFERKEDLFWAALRSSLSGLEFHQDLISAIAEGANPEIVFPKLFRQLADATILQPELLPLIVIALIELPWKASAVLNEHLSPVISAVNEYVARGIKNGKLRKVNSTLVTAAMISTAVGYPAFAPLIAPADIPYSDDREASRAFSVFWLELLAPIRPAPANPGDQSGDPSRN